MAHLTIGKMSIIHKFSLLELIIISEESKQIVPDQTAPLVAG